MMIFKKAIPRRTFLRGAGASLALPFLDAMVPAFASSEAARPPLRLGYIYLPVGRIMENWTPRTEGTNFDLPPTLAPFAPYREQMLVLSGLDLKAADLLPGEAGGEHPRPCAAYMTGAHPYDDRNWISADQVVANAVGQETPLASMQLGIDPPEWASGNDGSFRGFYRTTISWSQPTTMLPVQNNPRKVFERLFGNTGSLDPATMRRRNRDRGSVLDAVNGRVKQLMGTVDASDRHKLEEYLTAVRDIERGIQAAESRTMPDSETLANAKRPAGIPETYSEHARLMFDMLHLAYQTDMTRVMTFMMGHEGSTRTYLELGAFEGHHASTHHQGLQEAIDRVKKIDRHQSEQVSYFLEKMRATKELDGTSLLDNTFLVAGSALSDANVHWHYDLPVAVFGGAQGRLKGGRHIHYDNEPLSNLHLFALDLFGVSPNEYLSNETSDATGVLNGLA